MSDDNDCEWHVNYNNHEKNVLRVKKHICLYKYIYSDSWVNSYFWRIVREDK